MTRAGFLAAFLAGVSCGADDQIQDERTPIGPESPAARYCITLGYDLTPEEHCRFPDGSTCDSLAFYRAECGQAFTRCAKAGGTVRRTTTDAGTWTAVSSVCTLPGGQTCNEPEFATKGTCG